MPERDREELATPGAGSSAAFLAVVELARRLAGVPRPILIRGERGTGKELLARFVHQRSGRDGGRYVVLNCAAFPSELFDAALFGHEKGAYTGANERRPGKLELADGGTLFLDEVANMPRSAQQKLLRVIEYQRFERVGGAETLAVDVRVIAATDADLEALMKTGDFLPDLYDRLSFAELTLPPLRRRREDIPELVEECIARLHQEIPDLVPKRFSDSALADLQAYHWPGNVRQLRNVVERVYISDADGVILSSELPLEITSVEPMGRSFEESVRAFEKSLLLNALKDSDGSQRDAARRLGMSYDQFRHYYKKYRLGDMLA